MRLTEKDGTLRLESVSDDKWSKAIKKLSQLEDIEEELGVDLLTLFKAMKQGIYYVYDTGERKDIYFAKKNFYDDLMLCKGHSEWFLFISREVPAVLSDYGKKWALTKEELE